MGNLSLLIRAKAMLLALRTTKSSESIFWFLGEQSWTIETRLRMARIRSIADGIAPEPTKAELYQLKILVEHWERNAHAN